MATDRHRRRTRLATALALVSFALIPLAGVLASPASAPDLDNAVDVLPTFAFESYPSAWVPPTCTAENEAILVGERYGVDGVDDWKADFRKLNLHEGDTVVMAWDGFAPGCESATIGLSLKIAYDSQFDVGANQWSVSSSECGPASGFTCAELGNRLRLSLDFTAWGTNCYQLDAHMGPELGIVGPGGDYYHENFNHEHGMLIGAKNGGTQPCGQPEPCPYDQSAPAASKLCNLVLAPAPTTTTTAAPPNAPVAPDAVPQTPPSTVFMSPTTIPNPAVAVTPTTTQPPAPEPQPAPAVTPPVGPPSFLPRVNTTTTCEPSTSPLGAQSSSCGTFAAQPSAGAPLSGQTAPGTLARTGVVWMDFQLRLAAVLVVAGLLAWALGARAQRPTG